MSIYDRYYERLEEKDNLEKLLNTFNNDRNEILQDLNKYNHKGLSTNVVEYDNILESTRVGFYTRYNRLPTREQEITIGYAVLDNMMQRYVK